MWKSVLFLITTSQQIWSTQRNRLTEGQDEEQIQTGE